MKKLKKTAVALSFLAGSAGVAWASCGGTEGLVVAAVGQGASMLVSEINSAATSLTELDDLQTEYLLSAIRVATKQIQTSGDKSAATAIQAEQAAAAFSKELADKELVDKVIVDYMSQGFVPCEVSTATRNLARAELQAKGAVPNLVRTEIEATGGRYADPVAAVRAREERHRSLFCTQAEVDAGICSSVGRIPGGDMNAAMLFSTDTSTDARAAKNAVINNLVGLPDAPIPQGVATTPEAQAYVLAKKRKDAFLAWPAYSLKAIQTDNETVVPVLNERVGMYFGTAKAAEWAKSQASQAPRGLLIDMVKIAGLALKIQERRLWQNLRTEANLAVLVELENEARNGGGVEQGAATAGIDAGRRSVR